MLATEVAPQVSSKPALSLRPIAQERSAPEPLRVEDHLPLVYRVAERMARKLPKVVQLGDLIGAGTLGLLDAIEKYDAERCDRFSAYAEIRIRGAILDELRAMDWVPRSVRSKGHRLDDALATLAGTLGRAPSDSELGAFLGLTDAGVEELRRDVRDIAVVPVEDLSTEGFGGFAGDARLEPGHELETREMHERLARAVTRLPERERQVLSLYYVEELKLKEIGEIFGVTESRVCQVHTQAISRLRKLVAAQEWHGAAAR